MASNVYTARALFDFVGENSNELNFNQNEILTITSASNETPWWSAQNSLGQTGLIPSNYVELIYDEPELPQQIPTQQNTQYAYGQTQEDGLSPELIPKANHSLEFEPEQPQIQFSNFTPINDWPIPTQPQTQEETLQLYDPEIRPDSSFGLSPASMKRNDYVSAFEPVSSSANNPYIAAMNGTVPQNPAPLTMNDPFQQNYLIPSQSDTWNFESYDTSVPNVSSNFPFGYPQTTTTEIKQEQRISSLDNMFYPPSEVPKSSNVYDLISPTTVSYQSRTAVPEPITNTSSMPVENRNTNKPLSEAKSEELLPQKTSKTNADKKKFFTLGRKKGKPELEKRLSISGGTSELSQQITDANQSNSLTSTTAQNNTLSTAEIDTKGAAAAAAAKARFFDKHGIDNYLLRGCKTKSDEQVQINFGEREGGVHWIYNATMAPFTCKIEEPSKVSKLAGAKSFMEYKIHTEISGNRFVARRYKHFDWFHTQLTNKFRFICIPPLPGKQITGRFEQEFVAERRRQLEMWLNRICRHPVLSASFAVQHFVSCERTEANDKEWKAGKRKIEKDESKDALWLNCVSFLNSTLSDAEIQLRIDEFAQHQPNLEIQLRNLGQGLMKYLERHTEIYERDIQRIGELFAKFQKVLQIDTTTPGNQELSDSTLKVSNAYNSIADLYKTKASEGIRDFNERVQEYIGLLTCFPLILNMQKSSFEFMRSLQQRPPADFNSILHRSQVLNHVVLAEINFFQKEKVKDLNLYMKTLIDEQVQFYEKITSELKDATVTFH
ncbi:unnamed protein product [Rotaria magnacalcarata]